MKNLIFIISLVGAMTSFASTCPDLTGSYKCDGGSWPGGHIKQIVQKNMGTYTEYFVTPYTINGKKGMTDEYITDGKSYDLGGVKESSSCSNGKLIVKATTGMFSSRSDYSLDANKNLKISTRNVVIPSWEVCNRIRN